MAGVAIPLVLTAIDLVKPFLPQIIQGVKSLFGHGDTALVPGDQRMQMALNMAVSMLQAFANSGKVPADVVKIIASSFAGDPALKTQLQTELQKVYDGMKVTGQIDVPVPIPPVVPLPAPAKVIPSSVATANGRTFLILEVT